MLNLKLILGIGLLFLFVGVAQGKSMEEQRKISDEGIKFIKSYERVIHHVYNDGVGEITAGVGHKLTEADKLHYHLGSQVSETQVDGWLRQDLAKAESCVNNWVVTELSQSGFDALVSFVFNVGCEAFKRSTLLKLLNRGLIEDASSEFNKFVFSKGKKLNGLVARRQAESRLFRDAEVAEEIVT